VPIDLPPWVTASLAARAEPPVEAPSMVTEAPIEEPAPEPELWVAKDPSPLPPAWAAEDPSPRPPPWAAEDPSPQPTPVVPADPAPDPSTFVTPDPPPARRPPVGRPAAAVATSTAVLGELGALALDKRAVTVNERRIGKLEPGFGFGSRLRSLVVLLLLTLVVAAMVGAVLAISIELISVWANNAISKSAGN
jgi:hypothetical protein